MLLHCLYTAVCCKQKGTMALSFLDYDVMTTFYIFMFSRVTVSLILRIT